MRKWIGLAAIALCVVLMSGGAIWAVRNSFSDTVRMKDGVDLAFGDDEDIRALYDEATNDRLELRDPADNVLGYWVDLGTTGALGVTGRLEVPQIGIVADPDLMALTSGMLTVNGEIRTVDDDIRIQTMTANRSIIATGEFALGMLSQGGLDLYIDSDNDDTSRLLRVIANASDVNLSLSEAGALDIAGTITAGSGNTTITSAAGEILHAAIEQNSATDGQVLAWDNGGGVWAPSDAGSGDVSSSATITDHAVVRGDGGAKGVQDTGVIIDDTDNIDIPGTITAGSGNETITSAAGELLHAAIEQNSATAGQVLTWNNTSGVWEPDDAPGAAGGETNTASNLGAGVGVFEGKVSVDLQFNSLVGASGIAISEDDGNDEIDIALDIDNLTADTGVGATDKIPIFDAANKAITFANFEAAIDHDALTNFASDEHVAHTGVTLTAGSGLSGGGDISASRSFDIDITELTDDTSVGATDTLLIQDGANKEITFANFEGSIAFANLSDYSTFIDDLSAETTIDTANDYIPFDDATDGPNRMSIDTLFSADPRQGQVWLSAQALSPTTTNGAADPALDANDTFVMAFDPDAAEYGVASLPIPTDYDNSTAVTCYFLYYVSSDWAAGDDDVEWHIESVAIGNSVAMNTAYGTAATVIDGWQTGETVDEMLIAASTSMTIGGTASDANYWRIRVSRDATDATNDTCTADANLVGVLITYAKD